MSFCRNYSFSDIYIFVYRSNMERECTLVLSIIILSHEINHFVPWTKLFKAELYAMFRVSKES